MDKKLTNLHQWISTCGGIGLLPIMPGTWCSLIIAVPGMLFIGNAAMGQVFYAACSLVFFALGIYSTKKVQGAWGADPTEVVIDEAAGMSIVMTAPIVYGGWEYMLGAVFLFRVFDVFKPWPISVVNNGSSAWNVMVDDVLAAVFAVVAIYLGSIVVQGALVFFLSS